MHAQRSAAGRTRPARRFRLQKSGHTVGRQGIQVANGAGVIAGLIAFIQVAQRRARPLGATETGRRRLPLPGLAIFDIAAATRWGFGGIVRPAAGATIAHAQKRPANGAVQTARGHQLFRREGRKARFH